jgi:D-beta-D-heptose 7-phosphate kinase/D-beta-D-heptose 1-phosphate adenosyltransferase
MKSKITSLSALKKIVRSLKKRGKKIVFTNGCFDLIHYGHVSYLEKAKSFGDYLVIGLNTDNSVRRLKGPGRPLVPECDRAQVLAALEAVDFVVLFGDETPQRLISEVRPHILVKGSDYKVKDIVGNDIVKAAGGRVVRIPLAKGRSTTSLIHKIINVYGEK